MSAPAKKYPLANVRNALSDTRAGRIVGGLCAVYPGQISALHLMGRAGFSHVSEPVLSFNSFCNDFIKINQELAPFGWQAVRTGGTPDDRYRLAPVI